MSNFNTKECLNDSCSMQKKLIENAYVLSNQPDVIEKIREILTYEDPSLILHFLKYLSENIKIQLLPEVLNIMKYLDGNTKTCQEIVLSINKEWLKENLWTYCDSFFDYKEDDYQLYGIFMYLFESFDLKLAENLAKLALNNDNEDVKEIGLIFFDKLEV